MKEHTQDVLLGRVLGECAAESIPDDLDLWPGLRARLHAQPDHTRRPRLQRLHVLAATAAALMATFILGAAVPQVRGTVMGLLGFGVETTESLPSAVVQALVYDYEMLYIAPPNSVSNVGADAAAMPQGSEAPGIPLMEQLLPGKVLHRQYEYYKRHGSAAAQIAADLRFLPERYYRDSWLEVGDTGDVVSAWSVTKDPSGVVYQRGFTRDGKHWWEYVRADEVTTAPFTPYSAQAWLERVSGYVDTLPGKGYHKVGEGLWDGKKTGIYEMRYDWELPAWPEGQYGYSVPWLRDLEFQEFLERYEVVLENPLINHTQRWVIDAQGKKTLFEERKTVLLEVVDADTLR